MMSEMLKIMPAAKVGNVNVMAASMPRATNKLNSFQLIFI